ncbi:hypothetical protein J4Q44_G00260080 [Coregonus suidteri]|uniref:Uncharacterized protein n=1 Tax=Coregonus suidteri TaxID=861788 RepID=A0AAN8L7U6_9TELE
MNTTFAHRRQEVINQCPSVEDLKDRWPALFEASIFVFQINDEFQRLTTKHLEPRFMAKLDQDIPKLLSLFHSKGGALGHRLRVILDVLLQVFLGAVPGGAGVTPITQVVRA